MTYIGFPILSLIYIILLLIIYFSKKRLNLFENKLLIGTMSWNVFGLISELLCYYAINNPGINQNLQTFIFKTYVAYIAVFNLLLNTYIMILTNKNYGLDTFKIQNYAKNTLKLFLPLAIILITLIYLLPIHVFNDGHVYYTYGNSINLLFLMSVVMLSIWTIRCIIAINNKRKKYLGEYYAILIGILFIGIAGSVSQFMDKSILIITSIHSLILAIIYFTIENPDLIMIEELTKAKSISERTNDEKSKFLFEVTDDIEDKLDKVDYLYDDMNSLNPSPEIKEDLIQLKGIVDTARVKIKKTIDVSELDARKLKIINQKYNPSLIINTIYAKYKNDVNSSIDFRLNLSNTIPKELYGDPEKIKQIIATLICNSIKYTEKGFIEIRINSIIKYDVCRLIISVEDSGQGMDLSTQNEILSNHEDLTDEEIKIIDNSDLNLKMIRKLVNLIGGSFIIESNPNVGTKVKVILDQKLVNESKTIDEEKIESYSNDFKNQTRIAVISLNKVERKEIKHAISIDAKIEEYNQTLDCLNKIRNNIFYDYLLIDDNMDKIDARTFLTKCKEVDHFNGKIIVITKNSDLRYRKELLDFGFSGIITLPVNKVDMQNIIK